MNGSRLRNSSMRFFKALRRLNSVTQYQSFLKMFILLFTQINQALNNNMNTLTDLVANFGDVLELSLPNWNLVQAVDVLSKHPGWTQYNHRKPNNRRQGLSVTSLDGGFSGIPDLDSLREYNLENSTQYNESHFRARTSIVNHIPELNLILDKFPDHGRCHFLRLDSGGFFPPHRDNGISSTLPKTFRLIVPICNFDATQLVWIQDGRILNFIPGRTYFINTTKVHSLFSFVDMSCCFVMNVEATETSLDSVLKNLSIK
jgi:hypothetical protein